MHAAALLSVSNELSAVASAVKSAMPPAAAAQDEGLREAAEGFEAVFVASLLREMLTNEEGKGLLGSGPGSGVLASLLEQTLAEQIAGAGGFGIGERLIESLGRPDPVKEHEGEAK